MRRNNILRTSVALAAATALLGACSESSADDDDKADRAPSSSPTTAETSAPTEEVDLPDGVLALPERDAGEDHATLNTGRYRIPLDSTLAFDVDVADGTSAHDGGLFLSTGAIVIKTEIAGKAYGVPTDPCTDHSLTTVGPAVEDLVQALTDLSIYQVSSPRQVRLSGRPATYLEARVPRGFDNARCEGGAVELPGNAGTTVSYPAPYVGRWWVLDVDGTRVVVQQNCWECTADQLVDAPSKPESITFTSAG